RYDDHVAQYGVRPILLVEDRAWTNEEIRDQSRALAGALSDLGLKPGYRAVLAAPCGREALLVAVAVWRTGGVVVPVGSGLPARELEGVVDLCEPALIFSSADPDPIAELPLRNVKHWITTGRRADPFLDLEDLIARGPVLDSVVASAPGDP